MNARAQSELVKFREQWDDERKKFEEEKKKLQENGNADESRLRRMEEELDAYKREVEDMQVPETYFPHLCNFIIIIIYLNILFSLVLPSVWSFTRQFKSFNRVRQTKADRISFESPRDVSKF